MKWFSRNRKRFYHITYSYQFNGGYAYGRMFIETTFPINTRERIKKIEAYCLADAKQETPTAEKLMLTWWKELES